jgi:acetate kinase
MLVLTLDACGPGLQTDLVAVPEQDVRESAQLAQPHDRRLDELFAHDPEVVAHRVPDGTGLSIVDDSVRNELRQAAESGDRPMPETLTLLDTARERLPDATHVVCPDTALPHRGHGLSIGWARRRAAQLLERPAAKLDLVVVHAGEDWTVCASRGGACVDDTSGSPRAPMDTEDGYVSGLRKDIEAAAGKLGGQVDAIVFTGELGWAREDLPGTVCAGLPFPVHRVRSRPELELAEIARNTVIAARGVANPRRVRLDEQGIAHS